MTDHSTARARYHVEGQTSTVGPRWGIWDGVDGHFLRYRNIADEGDAVALCAKLNEYARALTPPEGDTVSEGDLEERLFGEFGVFQLAMAGAGASAWRDKQKEFADTRAMLLAALQSRIAQKEGSAMNHPLPAVIVERGDTLSEIAERELGVAAMWHVLKQMNRIPDERLIQPGDLIIMPRKYRP
jgi:hypothetical protein